MRTVHATETQLALFHSGDLGLLEGLRVRWHVGSCERCANELAGFEEARAILEAESGRMPAEGELAAADWQRLSAEMTANIHLGIEAGECVRELQTEPDRGVSSLSWDALWRPGLALAGAVTVLYAGTWMITQKMNSRPLATLDRRVVLEAKPDSLQIRSNGAAFSLVRASAAGAGIAPGISVGMGGSLQAREIDEDTGQVTIYHVYAE